MSVPYVDPDLYIDSPLNSLTRSSDIIEKQLLDIGVSLDQIDPISAQDTSSKNSFQPMTAQGTSTQSPLDIFTMNADTMSQPVETGQIDSLSPSANQKRIVLNGPNPTKETLGQIA